MKSASTSVSSRLALGLTALAACLGFGVGFGAHGLIRSGTSSSGSGPSVEAPVRSPTTTDSGLLGDENVLAAADLGTAFTETVKLDSVSQSEGHEALLCQRRALATVATLDGLVKAVYVSSGGTLLAEEIAVTVGVPPQKATLERTLIRWNDTCGASSPTPSRRIDLDVTGAQAWSFSGVGRVPWYAVTVRDGDRLAWLLLSPYEQAADPAALAQVARSMIDKLAS